MIVSGEGGELFFVLVSGESVELFVVMISEEVGRAICCVCDWGMYGS